MYQDIAFLYLQGEFSCNIIFAKIKNRGKIPRFFKIIFIIAYYNIFKGLPPKNNIKQSY